ncbi:MAG: NADPH:quinone oxidoreductase family protein [Proteobacteria bacterium]|nr:NADPH:quinone oxidoreductase family protein [Pseudomonadota bacterium]
MKALLCTKFGPIGDLVWTDVQALPCGPMQVRYRTAIGTLGFMDTLMVRGMYQLKPPLPFVPGAVSAGVVTEVGSGVTRVRVGQRISALDYFGAFVEERVVGEEAVVATPDNVDDAQAAAFRLTFSPSYLALVKRARLETGETLVVTGATGGIGFSAMQLGRYLGARVIGAVGSPEKAAFLHANGFEESIDYSRESLKDRVNEMTDGRGADVIFEVIGGDIFDQSLRCINMFGRILVLGFASGRIADAPTNLPLLKNCAVIGSFLGGWMKRDPAAFIAMNEAIVKLLGDSGLRVPIARTFDMADGAEAMATLLRRDTIGKIMLTP